MSPVRASARPPRGRGPSRGSGPARSSPGPGVGGVGRWVVLGLAAAGLWVWATGQLAAVVSHRRWPAVALIDVPVIVGLLPGTWGDPAAAWPAAARPLLPGAVGFAMSAVAVGVLLGVATVLGWWLWRAGRNAVPHRWSGSGPRTGGGVAGTSAFHRPHDGGGARWARGRDLRPLVLRRSRSGSATGGRLVVGRSGRRLVATEARHSVLVVGPTQSGKTTGLAVPAILEWAGPVVATSVKDDLAAATVGHRSHQGMTWIFDPTGTSGVAGSARWSPLAEASTWSGAQRMAAWLVDAAPARSGMSDGAFWFAAAAKLLAPLLLAASTGGGDGELAGDGESAGGGGRAADGGGRTPTMADVVRWNDSGDLEEPLELLARAGPVEALVALQACEGRDDRLRSSVATTLEAVLSPFADPVVAAATDRCDIDVDALVSGTDTLYLCGPAHEQHRVQGLFAGLVSSVVAAAVDEVHRRGRPLDPPLLLVLDEAANIAPVRDLDTLASTAAGLGIQLVTVCQDLAQLATRYGAERSRTIANNHRAKLVLSGVSDLSTLDLISGLVGDAAVREHSDSADLRDGRRTRTSTVAYRRLAPTDSLRRISPGHGVLVYGHLPAARVSLRPWYADRALRARAEIGRPTPVPSCPSPGHPRAAEGGRRW